jgi:dTDP-4-dehydrorhamnose 3,5-epimerase
MRLQPLELEGLYLIQPEPIADTRGFFARCFSADVLRSEGLVADFPEWSLSFNRRRGTLRGLHWQAATHAETKLVQCVRGAIFDVAVDVRPGSPTRGRWLGLELTADNRNIFYIPAGFAHGFQTLTDDTEIYYHISEPYVPEASRGVRWNDPDIAVTWPAVEQRTMSARDEGLPMLVDVAG